MSGSRAHTGSGEPVRNPIERIARERHSPSGTAGCRLSAQQRPPAFGRSCYPCRRHWALPLTGHPLRDLRPAKWSALNPRRQDEAQLRTQLAGASFLQHMHAAWSRAPGAGPAGPTDDHPDDDAAADPPSLSALFRSAETGAAAASAVPRAAVVASPAEDAHPLAVVPAGGGTAVPGEGGAAPPGPAGRRLGTGGDAYPPGYPSSTRFRAEHVADRTAPDDDPLSADAATRDVAALLRPPRRSRGAATPAAPAPGYIAGQIYVHGHLQLLVAGDAPAASAEELEELDADEAIV